MKQIQNDCSPLNAATNYRNNGEIIIDNECDDLLRMLEIAPIEAIDDRIDIILKLDNCPDRLFKRNGCSLEIFEVNALLNAFLLYPITGGLYDYDGYTAYSSLEYDGFEVHINNRLLQRLSR